MLNTLTPVFPTPRNPRVSRGPRVGGSLDLDLSGKALGRVSGRTRWPRTAEALSSAELGHGAGRPYAVTCAPSAQRSPALVAGHFAVAAFAGAAPRRHDPRRALPTSCCRCRSARWAVLAFVVVAEPSVADRYACAGCRMSRRQSPAMSAPDPVGSPLFDDDAQPPAGNAQCRLHLLLGLTLGEDEAEVAVAFR